ncbi:hypothetical protein V1478_016498 [Vespula squamosa]|uniref:Secreted protein n=1 Tax=Vespula squamosa TaxID=30214 RepID=A0ABD1ZZX9_VESSQ
MNCLTVLATKAMTLLTMPGCTPVVCTRLPPLVSASTRRHALLVESTLHGPRFRSTRLLSPSFSNRSPHDSQETHLNYLRSLTIFGHTLDVHERTTCHRELLDIYKIREAR